MRCLWSGPSLVLPAHHGFIGKMEGGGEADTQKNRGWKVDRELELLRLPLLTYFSHYPDILYTLEHMDFIPQMSWGSIKVIKWSLLLLPCLIYNLLLTLNDGEDVILSPASVTTVSQECTFTWTVQVNTRVATSQKESLCNCWKNEQWKSSFLSS